MPAPSPGRPTGSTLAYVFGNGIYSFTPSSGHRLRIGGLALPESDPMIAGFSRDGRRVAWASIPWGSSSSPVILHVVAVNGSDRSRIPVPDAARLPGAHGIWVDLD